jgi:quercetin dioxygenase-like cupin family protein
MFANYTDRARNAVAAAKAEARRLNHDYIGTEHVLIGLMAESGGGVVTTLSGMGFDIHLARTVVDKFARSAPTPAAAAALLPLTPKARRALAYARFSSRDTGGKQVDAEHVLLGLLEIPDGLAYQMLEQSGVSIAALREQIGKIVQSRPASTPPVPTPAAATFWAAGTGRTWQPGGALAGQSWKLIAGGDDTGGSHTAFDVTFTPSPTTAEARTITMERFDVSIYVLEGSLTILAADRSFAADAGAFVRIPRGTPHSITATTASRAMVMTTPGGSEKWIADFGRTAAEDEK